MGAILIQITIPPKYQDSARTVNPHDQSCYPLRSPFNLPNVYLIHSLFTLSQKSLFCFPASFSSLPGFKRKSYHTLSML